MSPPALAQGIDKYGSGPGILRFPARCIVFPEGVGGGSSFNEAFRRLIYRDFAGASFTEAVGHLLRDAISFGGGELIGQLKNQAGPRFERDVGEAFHMDVVDVSPKRHMFVHPVAEPLRRHPVRRNGSDCNGKVPPVCRITLKAQLIADRGIRTKVFKRTADGKPGEGSGRGCRRSLVAARTHLKHVFGPCLHGPDVVDPVIAKALVTLRHEASLQDPNRTFGMLKANEVLAHVPNEGVLFEPSGRHRNDEGIVKKRLQCFVRNASNALAPRFGILCKRFRRDCCGKKPARQYADCGEQRKCKKSASRRHRVGMGDAGAADGKV